MAETLDLLAERSQRMASMAQSGKADDEAKQLLDSDAQACTEGHKQDGSSCSGEIEVREPEHDADT